MYSVNECPNNDKVWEPIDNDELDNLKELKTKYRDVLEYLQNHTGWNTTHDLGKAADVTDNLFQFDFYNESYPEWIANPKLANYTGETLKAAIMEFAEIHPRSCAYASPCRSLMAGYWLNDIIDKLNDAKDQKNKLKVVGYSSHTEITLSVMKLLGIVKDEVTTSAGFVIEFKLNQGPAIRILNHDPNPIDTHVIYNATLEEDLKKLQRNDGFIPLADYLEHIKPNAFSDWRAQCDAPTCSRSASTRFLTLSSLILLIAIIHGKIHQRKAMRGFLIVSLVFLGVAAHELLPKKSVKIDKNTVLVLFGTRHGNRHPEEFLEENPRSWGYEGNTELTSFGKSQGLGLGKELRSFIGDLVSRNYNSSQVKYYSSSANRCQMTLQTVTAALHDPEQWGDWNKKWYDHWSPVPYTIDDPLLRMYAVKECKGSDKVWKPISTDTLPTLK
ncbi:unnamed protein product [Caenorhabditis bovis]|uniref:Uncharacterized protein n=1 Tax=Caenorhabditis bovis TaxID=2654633 RepID=A0A8S1FAG8_9PELO|nr:unnamed protein product [Caenorhabditis bovis]